MQDSSTRYAIYYAPRSDETLWHFGSQILAYDASTAVDITPPDWLGDYLERWSTITSDPRKYGFHATLKAPFHLAAGIDETLLLSALKSYAGKTAKARCEGLRVKTIGPFIGLAPHGDESAINDLAFSIVEHFEPFRAPVSNADRARRLASPLTARQIEYLDRYGYPYVKDEFRFHMTLTGALHQDDRQTIARLLEKASETPLASFCGFIDRICLFKQDEARSRFRIIGSAELREC